VRRIEVRLLALRHYRAAQHRFFIHNDQIEKNKANERSLVRRERTVERDKRSEYQRKAVGEEDERIGVEGEATGLTL
jgi:hypothetical protein